MPATRSEDPIRIVSVILTTCCACSGRSDVLPPAPVTTLSYQRSWVVAVRGEPLHPGPLVPIWRGGAPRRFSVAPPLPLGLQLDTRTGEISGTPSILVYPGVTHTITATNQDGETTTELRVAVFDGYVVNDLGDAPDAVRDGVCETALGNGVCTLRAALQEVGDPRGVLLPPGTIAVGSEIEIAHVSAVIGSGTDVTVLSGGGSSRILHSLCCTDPPNDLYLSELTVRNGRGAPGGAAQFSGSNGGTLYASNTRFEGNVAGDRAGAVFHGAGSAGDYEYSTLVANSATADGGAIVCGGGCQGVAIRFSVLERNSAARGGAFLGGGSFLRLQSSTFTANTAADIGGALFFVEGTLDARNCTFHDNQGTQGSAMGFATTGNSPHAVVVNHCTFAGNTGSPALAEPGSAELTVVNSVLVDAEGGCIDDGIVDLDRGAIEAELDTCAFSGPGSRDSVPTGNIDLGALQHNGGAIPTMVPGPDSILLDAGSDCPERDARGYPRPTDHCDIGAVEVQPDES